MKADFPLSSAKIKALKNDLSKLTDVEFLRKELHRIADEIKSFDMHLKLSPQAKRRLKTLERRFHALKARLTSLQRQVDLEVNKFAKILRRSAQEAGAAVRAATTRKSAPAKKTSAKKTTSKKTSKKTATRRKAKA